VQDPILRLPAKAIGTLVAELCVLQDRVRSGETLEVPAISLLLKSGHSLAGTIVQVTKSGSVGSAALRRPEPVEGSLSKGASLGENRDSTLLLQHQDNPLNVSYIPMDAICGITVYYSPQNLHLLSSGQVQPVTDKIPTRLDLERKAQYLSEKLAGTAISIIWDELPRSEEARQSLDIILMDLEAAITSIRSDELGRTTIQQQVERIEIRGGPSAEVRLQTPVLTVYAAIQFQDLVYLAKSELKQAIERVL
jgi:hypothetical protein